MFYHKEEKKIHSILNKHYRFKKKLKKLIDNEDNYDKACKYIELVNSRINKYKNKLKTLLQNNNLQRILDHDAIQQKHIISVFDSVLTRSLKAEINQLTDEIMVVQSYYFDVLRDLIMNGYIYKGQKYVVFTASAGQIRTKKTVFIKESTYLTLRPSLMCGLTSENINQSEQKGVNINKFLAYLALCNSATEHWTDFDIDKTIVVDDLETSVNALVDFIDNKTFEITRQFMNIPINHTDGCGMILPRKNKRSFMVRMPWVKGLLVPFPFDRFAKQHNSFKVTDIYGREFDIIKDKIEVILTKSQFKMWKYYRDWDEYKKNFKRFNCQAAKCNEEEDVFPNAKLNYQMLQTLNEMTDEELINLSKESVDNITKIGRDKQVMLKVLGATKENTNKNYFQQALELYPPLLTDTYSKEVLKDVKKSLVKKAKSGKLDLNGKYTFIIPDLYAFCEKLFLNNLNPQGNIKNGEVFCSLYTDGDRLDCLRSPHLYREHAIRINAIDDNKRKWYVTKGLYASVHDPISKILQYDSDGDKALVTPNKILVSCAEKHMEGIVPLYYEMAVSGKELIDSETIYNGLVSAYTGGNIGEISNDISKIWNSDKPDIEVIKWLCMHNNFVIDYAKTLYKLQKPKEVSKYIKLKTRAKLPAFFKYAKNKEDHQTEEFNNSVVNRLNKIIPNARIVFNDDITKQFDYTILLNNPQIAINKDIINAYIKLNQNKRYLEVTSTSGHIYTDIRNSLLSINNDPSYVADVLVKYLYKQKPTSKKVTLFESFGDIIVENIKRNLGKYSLCEICGCEIESKQAKKYCTECANDKEKSRKRELKRKVAKINNNT